MITLLSLFENSAVATSILTMSNIDNIDNGSSNKYEKNIKNKKTL
jgi:hypothetical protein